MTTTDVVATANVKVDLPEAAAARALNRVLAGADLIGLQEWGGNRNRILRRTGRLRRFTAVDKIARRFRRRWAPTTGYVFADPILGPAGPIGARRDRYELLGAKAKLLAGLERLEPVDGLRSIQGPRFCTVATFRDHALDETVAVINYHLDAHVQAGKAGWIGGRPKRVARHIRQRRRVEQIIERRLDKGQTVYALGDSNEHGLTFPGLTSAYDGRPDFPGTLGRSPRRIDDVHGPGRAIRLDRLDVGSDHWAIRAHRPRRRGDAADGR